MRRGTKGYKRKLISRTIVYTRCDGFALFIIMPTFTVPGSAPAPAPAPAPAKKPSNRRKKPEPEPVPVPEPEHESSPSPSPSPEPESPVSEPTFPDIVILKQTEHNYIIKHNHYPIASSGSGGSTIPSTATAKPRASPATTFIQNDMNDLVSPNQIHKGQISKKRGRKPKAGLILNSKGGIYDTTEVPNIILHLKCHLADLKTNESISNYDYTPAISEVESYMAQSTYLQPCDISTQKNNNHNNHENHDDDDLHDFDSDTNDLELSDEHTNIVMNDAGTASASAYSSIQNDVTSTAGPVSLRSHHQVTATATATATTTTSTAATASKRSVTDASIQIMNERIQKEIMKKIHRLKYSFHNGESIQTKMNHHSACFWDTCEFDGPIYYIPIMIVNGVFQVYGCYCSPQCAVAALLKEPLDTSTKFERLHLLHLLYGTTSSKGFKPAPNPHYLLDKYYGNLTIQEYRALLKGPMMIHIVNKPLTHILPELYEDNNDFLVNSKVIPANSLKLKKKYKTMVVQSGAE